MSFFRRLRNKMPSVNAEVTDAIQRFSPNDEYERDESSLFKVMNIAPNPTKDYRKSKGSSRSLSSSKKKKKSKKKKSKRKKSKSDDDSRLAAVVDKVPTVHSFNSSASEDEMLEEMSRKSRYSTEADIPVVIWSDDDDDDKYSLAGSRGQNGDESLFTAGSSDSESARWRSWDEVDEQREDSETGYSSSYIDEIDTEDEKESKRKGGSKRNMKKKKKKQRHYEHDDEKSSKGHKKKSKKKKKGKKNKKKKTPKSREGSMEREEDAVAVTRGKSTSTTRADPFIQILNASETVGDDEYFIENIEVGADFTDNDYGYSLGGSKSKAGSYVIDEDTGSRRARKTKNVATDTKHDKSRSSTSLKRKTTQRTQKSRGKDNSTSERSIAENESIVVNLENGSEEESDFKRKAKKSSRQNASKGQIQKPAILNTKSLLSEDTWDDDDEDDEPNDTKSGKLKSTKTPLELDEYSFQPDPEKTSALVQCLRFYSCDGVAKLLDFQPPLLPPVADRVEGKRIAKSAGVDDEILAQRFKDVNNLKSDAQYEVMCDDKKSMVSDAGNSMLVTGASDDSSLDDLEEAPSLEDLKKSPSIVVELTGRSLHLDDDTVDENRSTRTGKSPRSRTVDKKKGSEEEVSVTSIEIPGVQTSSVSEGETTHLFTYLGINKPKKTKEKNEETKKEKSSDSLASSKDDEKKMEKVENKAPKRGGWLQNRGTKSKSGDDMTTSGSSGSVNSSTKYPKKRSAKSFLLRIRGKRGFV